jgi:hypothetical protein
MSDLVRELELLSADIEWPATPAFVPRAAARAAPVRRRRRRARIIVAIAIAALLLAAGALAATGVIHFGGATIRRVHVLPPVDPAPTLSLGEPIRMSEARALLPVVLPVRLRSPDVAYEREGALNFLYLGPRGPRAVLTVFREGGTGILDKLVYTTTKIRRVRVQGAPGLYVADVHVVDFLYGGDPRLSQPTLLWVRGGLTYRLESREALALVGLAQPSRETH